MRIRTMWSITSRIFSGVGSESTRADASTPSASMHTAVSALCGMGPGYVYSMVFRDERGNRARDAMLGGKLQPVANMAAYDLRARRWLELVVRVASLRLI